MTKYSLLLAIFLLHINCILAQDVKQAHQFKSVNDIENVASLRTQVLRMEKWLKWRKENVLPEIMRQSGVDLWIVSRREGAIFYSLVPANYEGCIYDENNFLVFYDQGKEIEEISIGRDELAAIIKNRNHNKIGVNTSVLAQLKKHFGNQLFAKAVSSKNLETGFLEKRSPEELSVFEHVCRVAYDIIAEAFSNKVIIPDVTTTDDLNWWIRQSYAQLGLGTNNHPTITIQRSVSQQIKYAEGPEHFTIDVVPRNGYKTVIRRGDIISCDTGIKYFGMETDTQSNAYVLREGEIDVPQGLKDAMNNTNNLQNHFVQAFKVGKASRDIVNEALTTAQNAGLRPSIYSHPIPYYLLRYSSNGEIYDINYMAGPYLGGNELVEPAPMLPKGGYPVHENTVYAMELHCWSDVPEWENQKVRLVLETNVALKSKGIVFLGGRQTQWYVIK